jgi:hypothetical protein
MSAPIHPSRWIAGRANRERAMTPTAMPNRDDVDHAVEVLRAARAARTLARKRARRSALAKMPPAPRRYPSAAYECSWCGLPFIARVLNPELVGRRYCSESCRQLGYRARKHGAERAEQLAGLAEAAR